MSQLVSLEDTNVKLSFLCVSKTRHIACRLPSHLFVHLWSSLPDNTGIELLVLLLFLFLIQQSASVKI